jgi:hypothetical protein
MEDRDRCRDCDEKRPADAPGGLCPACVLRAGLAGGAPAEGDQDWHDMPDTTAEGASPSSWAATSAPGALARLAETLADIPRVHLSDTEPFTSPGPVVRPSSAEMPDPSDRLARLQLLGEVARGGMGVIIKGRDSDLSRDLTAKMGSKNGDILDIVVACVILGCRPSRSSVYRHVPSPTVSLRRGPDYPPGSCPDSMPCRQTSGDSLAFGLECHPNSVTEQPLPTPPA